MMGKKIYLALLIWFWWGIAYAQWPLVEDGLYLNPSDPSRPYTNLSLSGELFSLVEGQLWQYSVSGDLAFGKFRNQLGIQVPFVQSIIPGIENFSGIGDVGVKYNYVFFERKNISNSLTNATFSLNMTFPTGNQYLGEGVGRTMIIPGVTFAFKPADQIGIYPSIKYITSARPTTGRWAGGFPGAIPDITGSNLSKRISALQINSTFNLEFNETWLGLTPILSYDFISNDYSINLRPEIGKFFNDSFLIKINSTAYIIGQRKLLFWTQFVIGYYFDK